MDTARPATPTPNLETQDRSRNVRDLLFLLGPPVRGEAADAMAEILTNPAIDRDDLWVEMIRQAVRRLLEPGSDGRSLLDEILSDAVGAPVTAWGVQGLEHFQCGRRVPGFSIETSAILDAAGRPVARDFADRQLRGCIVSALLDLTHADWITCTAVSVVDEADELGFPNLDTGNEEPTTKGESREKKERTLTEHDAAVAWARAFNLRDAEEIAPLLAEHMHYASQWVFEEIENRADYLEHLEGKLGSIRSTRSNVRAELAETRPYPMYPNSPRSCVVVHQNGKPAATVLFQVDGPRITRIDLSEIPPPHTCALTGECPGLIAVYGIPTDNEPEA